MKGFLLALGLLASLGCNKSPEQDKMELGIMGELSTVMYENHKFLVAKLGVNGISVIHHPDCPCLKKEGK